MLMESDKTYTFKVVVEGRVRPWYFETELRPNTVLCSVQDRSRIEGTNDGGSWSEHDPNKTPEQYIRGHIKWLGYTITSIQQVGD